MPQLRKISSYWLLVGACALFFAGVTGGFALLIWPQLTAAERAAILDMLGRNGSYFISVGLVLAVALGFAVDFVFRLFILPMNRITEETGIIYGANPGHRIHAKGSPDIVRLAEAVNKAADRYDALTRTVDARVEEARTRAEADKNILSVVLAELPQGVLICTAEGRITLYNERVRQLLAVGRPADGAGACGGEPGGFVGLGRSLFGVVQPSLVRHAMEEIQEKLRGGRQFPTSSFVMIGAGERLLAVEAAAILSPHRELTGFVLVFTDVSGRWQSERQLDGLLHAVTTRMRGALAGIRVAVEVIRDYPALGPAKLEEFNRIIHEETLAVAESLEGLTREYNRIACRSGPLVPMRVRDLLAAVGRRTYAQLGLGLAAETPDEGLWVRTDSYALVLGFTYLIGRLKEKFGFASLRCESRRRAGFAEIDFLWPGPPVRLDTLRQWERHPAAVADHPSTLTFREIAERHNIEIWSQAAAASGEAYLRVLLPAVEPLEAPPANRRTLLPSTRPVFFDFDLFSQPGQVPELDDRPLAELSYTVFDTETTGLDPRGGDEIIAIGAVRIVNGRLLPEEVFDRLVDPRRGVPWEAVRVHGIQPEVLAGQPGIETVLRQFRQFAEGTVLVAHNAAFDMRLLQLKEAATGVRFVNPVLDTMLLSAVLHPAQERHELESIAERLGIAVIGRHTALGDAMATAEVFLKLMPLLSEKGMVTLRQARESSRKTLYARLSY
jgi:DNA polymerase-3 subunit epsilon